MDYHGSDTCLLANAKTKIESKKVKWILTTVKIMTRVFQDSKKVLFLKNITKSKTITVRYYIYNSIGPTCFNLTKNLPKGCSGNGIVYFYRNGFFSTTMDEFSERLCEISKEVNSCRYASIERVLNKMNFKRPSRKEDQALL